MGRPNTVGANCRDGFQLVPPMWSKVLAAPKAICASSLATWFCRAGGGSTFPLILATLPLVARAQPQACAGERLPVRVIHEKKGRVLSRNCNAAPLKRVGNRRSWPGRWGRMGSGVSKPNRTPAVGRGTAAGALYVMAPPQPQKLWTVREFVLNVTTKIPRAR